MPFTFYNPPTLTPEQTNPFNAALTQAFKTYGKGVQSAYMPKTLEANIFSKQFAPLAQIASNPVAMAMMGDQGRGIMNMISQLLKQQGSPGNILFNGNQNNIQNTTSGMGASTNSEHVIKEQATNKSDNTYNPNVPQAGGDIGKSAYSKAIAPFQSQVQKPGVTYYDPNTKNFYSSPTDTQINQAQSTMTAYNNLKELIPDLLKNSKKFENKNFEIRRANIAQALNSYGINKLGDLIYQNPELSGDYNNFIQSQKKAGIVYNNLYPSSNSQESYNQHMSMLSFDPSKDTYKTYQRRLQKVLNDAYIMYKNSQTQAGVKGGYNLSQSPEVPSLPTDHSTTNDSQKNSFIKNKVGYDPVSILNYKFKNAAEFKEAFNTLNSAAKKQVIDEMKRKGWY